MREKSPQIKKQIIEGLIESVENLADKEFQKRVWIRGDGPEVHDFDDAICDFSPAADAIIDEHEDFQLSKEQLEILKKFNEKVMLFSDDNDFPELFIDDPEWDEIVLLAKEVIRVFSSYKVRLSFRERILNSFTKLIAKK